MSINRKRSRTRSLVSYANEGVSKRSPRRKSRRYVYQKKYTFGLPPELTRSPVHGFYRDV